MSRKLTIAVRLALGSGALPGLPGIAVVPGLYRLASIETMVERIVRADWKKIVRMPAENSAATQQAPATAGHLQELAASTLPAVRVFRI